MAAESSATVAQMRALVEVARNGGFASAARALIGAGAGTFTARQLWQQVDRLEENLRERAGHPIPLMQRGGRSLTTAGQLIVPAAESVLAALARFEGAVADAVAGSTPTRVACYPAHAGLVVRAITSLARDHPKLQMLLQEPSDELREHGGAALLDSLRSGSLDVAIVDETAREAVDLEWVHLYDWVVRAISLNADIRQRAAMDVRELVDHKLLLSPTGHHTRELLEPFIQAADVYSAASVDALFDMAMEGFGVALLASDAFPVRRSVEEEWPIVQSDGRQIGGSYGVVHRRSAGGDTAVRALAEALRSSVLGT